VHIGAAAYDHYHTREAACCDEFSSYHRHLCGIVRPVGPSRAARRTPSQDARYTTHTLLPSALPLWLPECVKPS
jgi:hypothetical protein